MGNVLLERAAHQKPATTKRGVLERLFVFDLDEEETVALVNPRIVSQGAELEAD